MQNQLLKIIACPICYKKLLINKEKTGLICKIDNLIFPIIQGIPILLKEKALKLLKKL